MKEAQIRMRMPGGGPLDTANLAAALYREGKFSAAALEFEKAILAYPKHAAYRYYLGHCYLLSERPASANEEFKKLIQLRYPSEMGADIYLSLGNSYWEIKRYDDAATAYKECLRRDKTHGGALFGLGLWAAHNGGYSAAREYFYKALRHVTTRRMKGKTYAALGKLNEELSNSEAAKKHYEFALSFDPQNDWAIDGLSRLQVR